LGTLTENPKIISETIVSYFRNILNNFEGSNKLAQDKMLKNIPSVITKEDNKILNKPISIEEVKTAIFSMHSDKSPGPDGFQTFFSKNVGILSVWIYGRQ
jgi:hypothetical protein